MSRTFVIGDIHGAYRALRQCLQRSSFDYDHDYLISLGDVCDGWPETKSAIDELLRIKNLSYIFGNHDFWTLEWMKSGFVDDVWLAQGGAATIKSYAEGVPENHIQFLEQSDLYKIIENRLFVHAGFDPRHTLDEQGMNTFLWDRTLALDALGRLEKNNTTKLTSFDEVYIGHTPIGNKPIQSADIWLLDTGAGWSGVLSMMDIYTKEVFTSDPVPELYPGVEGRKKRR